MTRDAVRLHAQIRHAICEHYDDVDAATDAVMKLAGPLFADREAMARYRAAMETVGRP